MSALVAASAHAREDATHRDAHGQRSRLVVGHRPHRDAVPGPAEEDGETDQDDAGDDDGQQPVELDRDPEATCVVGRIFGCSRTEVPKSWTSDFSTDDRPIVTMMTLIAFSPTRAQDEPLDQDAEQHRQRRRRDDRDDERQPEDDETGVEEVGADQEELALGEVDDLGRFVDEDKAQRRQREDRPVGQAVDGEGQEGAHRRPLQTGRRLRPSGTW